MRTIKNVERTSMNSARAVRNYALPPDEVLGAVEGAIGRLPRWTVEFSGERALRAVRRTKFLRFKDVVTVRVRDDEWGSEATFESASQIGAYDLGQNPRNVNELLGAVDRELR